VPNNLVCLASLVSLHHLSCLLSLCFFEAPASCSTCHIIQFVKSKEPIHFVTPVDHCGFQHPASSTDCILARINNIVHALQFPSPNLPLAPFCDSQVQALKQLMTVLHGTISPKPNATPATTLRVVPPVKIAPSNALPASPHPTSSLRRDPIALASNPTLSASPQPASSLRVHLPNAHADDVMVPTSSHTTPPPPLPATITTRPQTRSQCQPCCSPHLQALHATTTTATIPPPLHVAYHGNAFNPNTSEIAKYAKLSKSSDGPLWQMANATKIHHLA